MARLAELVATLSIATDHGMGFVPERGLRSAAVASRFAALDGRDAREQCDAYYLALLRYAGCTADSHLAADVFGDEVRVRGELEGVDLARAREVIPRVARAMARGKSPLRGAASAARTISRMPRLFETGRSHCEVADRLAENIGFDAPFRGALFQTFERWDGRGWTERLAGEAIAPAMRIVHLADEVEHGHRRDGLEGARAIVAERSGRTVDPALAVRFTALARDVCTVLDARSAWAEAMRAEPAPHRETDDAQFETVLRAIADFADLKSRFTRGHSRGVAALAGQAARNAGLGEAARTIEHAALLHDVGRVAVSASIWDKPAPLTDLEWESVRTHAYVGERILARATSLAVIADIASAAHERLDARGYHRRLGGAQCLAPARILAAADVMHALVEERPHRAALSRDRAAATLTRLGEEGALCLDAVRAVLGRASDARARPTGLTEREVEVLRLIARGRTNKEIATALDVSTRTAGHHVEHIFEKLGVTTRAAAAVVAMQRGLCG